MIGGLRKKFICISTISIFAVFSIILSLLLVLTRVQMNQTLDTLTDTIAANNGLFPEFDSSTLNSGTLGIDKCVDIIKDLY